MTEIDHVAEYARALGVDLTCHTLVASGGLVAPSPGTWIHLDGGTLDLGVVRDSVVNSKCDYPIFVETFES